MKVHTFYFVGMQLCKEEQGLEAFIVRAGVVVLGGGDPCGRPRTTLRKGGDPCGRPDTTLLMPTY